MHNANAGSSALMTWVFPLPTAKFLLSSEMSQHPLDDTKFGIHIHGSQRMNPNDFKDPLTFPLCHHEVHICGFVLNVWTTLL